MSGDRDSNKEIDISIIIGIFLIEKKFYVFIKLKNGLETFTIHSLVNMEEKGFFFIDY